jgi:hypothetical protein
MMAQYGPMNYLKNVFILPLLNYSTQSFAQRPNAKCVILCQGRGIRSYYNCFLLTNYCVISTKFEHLGKL